MDFAKFSKKISDFTVNRIIEIFGLIIALIGFFILLSLTTYSPADPNLVFSSETEVKNLFGFYGSFTSDLLFQAFGLISFLFCLTLILNGFKIIKDKKFDFLIKNFFFSIIYIIFGSIIFSIFYDHSYFLVINGNGGFVGNYFKDYILNFENFINSTVLFIALFLIFIIFFLASINLNIRSILNFFNFINSF